MLVPIVEGQSETLAIEVLLRRLIAELALPATDIARPFRVKRNKIVRANELERSIGRAIASRAGASAVLVLLDADDDCPAELGPQLCERASNATALPVRVVVAKSEIEAWVLAAVESVRGVRGIADHATRPVSPEDVRDAKRALSDRMVGSSGYVATADLAALLAKLDIGDASRLAPSFRKLQRDLAALCR